MWRLKRAGIMLRQSWNNTRCVTEELCPPASNANANTHMRDTRRSCGVLETHRTGSSQIFIDYASRGNDYARFSSERKVFDVFAIRHRNRRSHK